MELKDKIALSKVRLEHAKDAFEEAKVLLNVEKFKGVANRSYYAIFHAMRAVLVFNGFDTKSHKGVISEFRRLYIKTGIFSKEISKIIQDLFEIRTDSDYEDFYVVAKKDIKDQFKNSKVFINEIEKYLKLKYKSKK